MTDETHTRMNTRRTHIRSANASAEPVHVDERTQELSCTLVWCGNNYYEEDMQCDRYAILLINFALS